MANKRALNATVPKPIETSIVSDSLEIRRLLTRGAEDKTPTSLKIRGSETMLRSKLIDVDPLKSGVQLEFSDSLNEKSLAEEAEKYQTKECLTLIYLQGRSIVGLNAEPTEILKDRLVFAFPERLIKIQRRKDVRFQIPTGYEFVVEMHSIEQRGLRVRKKLVDISESGLSFFVLSPREAGLFRTGMLIKGCVIHMMNQRFEVDLKVCNQIKHERGGHGAGTKIGVEFVSISPTDRTYLGQFIYSQATHLFY